MSLLSVENLTVKFSLGRRESLTALDSVSFTMEKGEVLGIVGESGSGKSTLIRTILQLQQPSEGRIYWKGQRLDSFTKKQKHQYRQRIQMIFQDPLDALDPRMTIGKIIEQPLLYLQPELDGKKRKRRVLEIMRAVGLSEEFIQRYPHEFSGGQCQRIGIGRAMIISPELLVCDEPLSALDVSIQAQIVNLLMELRENRGMSMIFVSHDLSIVRHICNRILVLQRGKVVEINDSKTLYENPQHLYTRKLLASMPLEDPKLERERMAIWGAASSLQEH